VRLVACQACHAQYDVSSVSLDRIACRCGAPVPVADLESRDLAIHRCSSCGAHVAVGDDRCDYCGSGIVRDPRLLSLICPECCARNADEARFCGACGVVFDPQPIEVEKRELPCPVCTCLMPTRVVGALAINECPSCNGIWCPTSRFEALVEKALESKRSSLTGEIEFAPRRKGANPATQRVAYRKCPECDAFMQRRNFRKTSGVITDRCASHGTWLDADELEQIAGYLLSGGRPQAEKFMRETDEQAEAAYRAARLAGIAADRGALRATGPASLRAPGGLASPRGSRPGGGLLGLLASLLED
jgi:Zn-finger nucleic acid-binding protein